MPKKYYHAENCNQFFHEGGLQFTFEPYQHFAGTWRGLYATANTEEQAALASLGQRLRFVTEITQEDYDQKKGLLKTPFENFAPLPKHQRTQAPEDRLIPGAAQVVESPSEHPEHQPVPVVTSEPLKTPGDAIKVATVKPKK